MKGWDESHIKVTSPAQQHHDRVGFGRNESQKEDVTAATVVALQHRFSQRTVFMQHHLLRLGSHQVVHNMAESQQMKKYWAQYIHPHTKLYMWIKQARYWILPPWCVSTAITEPFLACVTVNHTSWIMNSAVTETKISKLKRSVCVRWSIIS